MGKAALVVQVISGMLVNTALLTYGWCQMQEADLGDVWLRMIGCWIIVGPLVHLLLSAVTDSLWVKLNGRKDPWDALDSCIQKAALFQLEHPGLRLDPSTWQPHVAP